MLEYFVGGLTVLVILMGGLAWIYRRGRSDGIDNACEKRIKDKVDEVVKAVKDHKADDIKTHKELFTKIDNVESKIDVLQGSFEIIKNYISSHR